MREALEDARCIEVEMAQIREQRWEVIMKALTRVALLLVDRSARATRILMDTQVRYRVEADGRRRASANEDVRPVEIEAMHGAELGEEIEERAIRRELGVQQGREVDDDLHGLAVWHDMGNCDAGVVCEPSVRM